MSPGVYIHVPYCARKCLYCSFNSYEAPRGVPAEYVEALARDLEMSAPAWEGVEFGSVYLGGGTPSLIDAADLARVLSALRSRLALAADVEITLEANPSSLGRPKLDLYREAGVNRLSIGLESLAAEDLRFLGRLHTADDALAALESAVAAGFADISCDVMIGIPGQSVARVEATLDGIAPRASHVSCYMLSVDPGTPLEALVAAGAVSEVDEGEMVGLYEAVADALRLKGLVRYEVSNWARPGLECRHNLVYWARGEYLGIGAGASSFQGDSRSKRLERPDEYVAAVLGGADPVCFAETIQPGVALEEEIMLRLRTARGLDLEWLAGKYGCDLERAGSLLAHLEREGLIVSGGENVQLTAKGILVSDSVICSLSASLSAS